MPSLSYRMPRISSAEAGKMTAAVRALRGPGRKEAEALLEQVGAEDLAGVLHAMRRWYSANAWTNARRLVAARDALNGPMDLRLPVGVYRGFKVPRSSPLLAGLKEGQTLTLPVTRNGSCSSWTAKREIADRFSGAGPDRVGLVVQLLRSPGAEAFLAPPSRSRPWFNRLYETTMGRSYRFNEEEYAIHAPAVRVRVVAMKRR